MKRSKRILKVSEIVISVHVEKLKGGDYLATSKILPGLVAQGRTLAETMEIAQDVARKLLESYRAHGDPLPSALQRQLTYSSKTAELQIPVAVNL